MIVKLRNEEAAATEIGYILTFFLGLMFLTTFSVWTFDIQQATEERWTNEAIPRITPGLVTALHPS